MLFQGRLLSSLLRPTSRAMVGPGSAAGAAAFNWPVFVLRAQREGEQVLRCNQFDRQTKAGAGLCLVYTGDTSSGSTQPTGAQGLFAEPARGFSFHAAASALGAWGLCPAPDQGVFSRLSRWPGHLASPRHPMRTVPQPPAQSSPARASVGPGSPQKPAFCRPLRPAERRGQAWQACPGGLASVFCPPPARSCL